MSEPVVKVAGKTPREDKREGTFRGTRLCDTGSVSLCYLLSKSGSLKALTDTLIKGFICRNVRGSWAPSLQRLVVYCGSSTMFLFKFLCKLDFSVTARYHFLIYWTLIVGYL